MSIFLLLILNFQITADAAPQAALIRETAVNCRLLSSYIMHYSMVNSIHLHHIAAYIDKLLTITLKNKLKRRNMCQIHCWSSPRARLNLFLSYNLLSNSIKKIRLLFFISSYHICRKLQIFGKKRNIRFNLYII